MNEHDPFEFDISDVIDPNSTLDPDHWRLLRRLRLPDQFNSPGGGTVKKALVIDVEATGLSIQDDDVIQLAMLPFRYEVESGRILDVCKDEAFEGLREPAVPISEEAAMVTGITHDMLVGQSIDESLVSRVVTDVDLVIAHNAAFDRPMVERVWPCFQEKPWSCTVAEVDWLREGFNAGKLDYLGMQFGWFYDGHRALADCEACLALLAQTLPASGRQCITAVREAALKKEYLVRAIDSPYDAKDRLKGRGYRWRPPELRNGNVWWTVTEDSDAEATWLSDEVYNRKVDLPIQPITALTRYSERLWDFK